MKALFLLFVLVGCGTEHEHSAPIQQVQYKNITSETLPDYEADRIEYVPFCSRSCEILVLKDGSRFFCFEKGGQWMYISGKEKCELGK